MSKIIGLVLIVAGLMVGYIGFNKVADSTKQINFLGLNISASDDSGRQQGYLYVGFAVLLFGGGVFIFGKSKQ